MYRLQARLSQTQLTCDEAMISVTSQSSAYELDGSLDDVMKTGKQVRISYAGRDASAAPACGSPYLHAKQQAQLVNDALAIDAE